jgi:lipopolysaccharide/colanic/teichoic acid biosynthesis glycosyltransferase
MSLIGPRPLLVKYLPYYTRRELLRHTVRPGISGWAQVHGRNNLDWDERLELDAWYAENVTLKIDLNVVIRTIHDVITRKDIIEAPSEDHDLDVVRKRMLL